MRTPLEMENRRSFPIDNNIKRNIGDANHDPSNEIYVEDEMCKEHMNVYPIYSVIFL
jgi:hypothetical protein